MSDKALKRIEQTLTKVVEQQEAICAELGRLAAKVEEGEPTATTEETIRFLDGFRAGEALGEASLGAWIEVSDVACVKGGLRTVQQREGFHARLLEARIKELGGTCEADLPEATHEAAMKSSANKKKGDAAKILDFVKQFPDCDAALAPIFEMADKLDHDPETQSLLRTIAQDERSTLAWFHEACQQLNG